MAAQKFDAVTIGSGLAGLAFALRVAEQGGTACVLTKGAARDANTSWAQGGIAAAVGESDSWKLHEADTLTAGAGLCNPDAVRFLCENAPTAIEWLQSLGAQFTVGSNGDLELGLEGGHSRNRIVHFEDRTGWEVERAMIAAVRRQPKIKVIEHAFVTQLLMDKGRCVGAAAHIEPLGMVPFLGKATMLATGGCGQLYRHTTNPRVATADGIALAHAVQATIADMEFMQFHPTTLYHQQLRSFLITEACRGAGGTLRNHHGERFMYGYDPRLELAPRDIVARSIDAEMKRLDTWCVYLDMTHLNKDHLAEEFPMISERLHAIGIDLYKDWIPVVPAQHYSCGGVVADLHSKTSVPGLYAAGEVASTGVHGANRLASNSLLEAMVFAKSAGDVCLQEPDWSDSFGDVEAPIAIPETDAVQLRKRLQGVMTDCVGIVRTHGGLQQAQEDLQELIQAYEASPAAPFAPYPLETRHLMTTAQYVVNGAIRRRQNVGLHYNLDQL